MRYISLICLVIFLSCNTVSAATASWNANHDDDGVTGYKIYYGKASGVYDISQDVGNLTEFIIEGLENNQTYYIAVTAYDASGNESHYSEEGTYMTPDTIAPDAPTGLKIVIAATSVIIQAERVVVNTHE